MAFYIEHSIHNTNYFVAINKSNEITGVVKTEIKNQTKNDLSIDFAINPIKTENEKYTTIDNNKINIANSP